MGERGARKGSTSLAARAPIDYSDEPSLTPDELARAYRYIRDHAVINLTTIVTSSSQAGMSVHWTHAEKAQSQIDNIEDRKRRDAVWGEGGFVGEIRLFHTAPPSKDDPDPEPAAE